MYKPMGCMAGDTASPNLRTNTPIASGAVAVSATSAPVVTIAWAATFRSLAACMVMPPLGAPITMAVSAVEFGAASCRALVPVDVANTDEVLLLDTKPPVNARSVIALTPVEFGASTSTALPVPAAEQLIAKLGAAIVGAAPFMTMLDRYTGAGCVSPPETMLAAITLCGCSALYNQTDTIAAVAFDAVRFRSIRARHCVHAGFLVPGLEPDVE